MDTSQPDPGVARPARRSWRRHSDEFKLRVIELARQGHGSVAAVALANGLNANMLRRWVRESEMADVTPPAMSTQAFISAPAFVPVMLADLGDRTPAAPEPTAAASAPERVTLEIRRGTTSVSASLPMDERSAAWLREVLA
jgi:transposase-like protein